MSKERRTLMSFGSVMDLDRPWAPKAPNATETSPVN